MPRSRTGAALAAVAALTLLGGPPASAAVASLFVDDDPSAGAAPTVELVYLANEGVLLGDGERKVAIDALFGDGLDGYPTVPDAVRARLEGATGEFAGIDLLLATHLHADHFSAAAVARHLTANPDALFVSTPAAVAAVAALPEGVALAPRLRGVLPREGAQRETLAWRGIRVTAFNLHHGRGLARPVDNLGFVVELGGRRVAHLGDTEANGDELATAFGTASPRLDLALVPCWRLLDADGRAELRRALAPRRLAAFHFPVPQAPAEYFGKPGSLAALRVHLAREWPGIVLLDRAGLEVEVGGA